MKKMIIAAITVLTVIATVIGCQVYDSQTNNVLFSGMNGLGEGAVSWEKYYGDFESNMKKFKDNTADAAAYNAIVDSYLAYEDFYSAALSKVTGINTDESADLHDPVVVKNKFKNEAFPIDNLATLVLTFKKKEKVNNVETIVERKDYENLTIPVTGDASFTLKTLYQSKYQLKWDWNSKKGR
jgi:hypothetical protein